MKICIITYWNSLSNYGQLLQCYALQQYLINSGHEVSIIKCTAQVQFYRHHFLKLRKVVQSPHKYLRVFYVKLLNLLHTRINKKLDKKRAFDKFRSKYIIFEGSHYYKNYVSLKENPPHADLYIVGSDQVWNRPIDDQNLPIFFLNFGNKNIKRISYAASFARSQISKEEKNILKKYLSSFDGISVREISGINICKSLGFTVKLCLDPTLLAGRLIFDKLILKTHAKSSNIFLYAINVINKKELYWNKINEFLLQTGFSFSYCMSSGHVENSNIIQAFENERLTIEEWLYRIAYCNFFITTSFHGVAFAILYHKPFMTILLKGGISGGNDRIISLLEKLKLRDRIYNEDIKIEQIYKSEIDWDMVDSLLSDLRLDSIDFLNSYLI